MGCDDNAGKVLCFFEVRIFKTKMNVEEKWQPKIFNHFEVMLTDFSLPIVNGQNKFKKLKKYVDSQTKLKQAKLWS